MPKKFFELTPKQQSVYKTLKDYIEEKRTSPTLRELQKLLSLKYIRSVTQFLDALIEKGYIRRTAQGIELTKTGTTPGIVSIPVIGSAGCDNLAVFAEPTYDDRINVSKEFLGTAEQVCAVKAMGRSMESSGIMDGDYVLVEVTDNVKSNDRVVAVVGDMAVIKRIKFLENAVLLNPDSPDDGYKPIILKERPYIVGKVMSIIKTQADDVEYFYEEL
jgi:SOS regulatory protein LexA